MSILHTSLHTLFFFYSLSRTYTRHATTLDQKTLADSWLQLRKYDKVSAHLSIFFFHVGLSLSALKAETPQMRQSKIFCLTCLIVCISCQYLHKSCRKHVKDKSHLLSGPKYSCRQIDDWKLYQHEQLGAEKLWVTETPEGASLIDLENHSSDHLHLHTNTFLQCATTVFNFT